MSLIKNVYVDQITVTDNGTVLVREVTQIMDGDIEVSKQYHRASFIKGTDVSNQPQQVQDICAVIWKE